MNKETGGPAFPLQSFGPDFMPGYEGMTLRDYFAAKAMEAWILPTTKTYTHDGKNQIGMLDVDLVAEYAFKQADAMLKAREA